jgi:transcriptional regulator with XRE-family HTH domain
MILLGRTARQLRKSKGLNQRQAAELLGVSVVHLCNIENNKSSPSSSLLERYRDLWGVDLYVLAWCLHGDAEKLPRGIRRAAKELAKAWEKQLGAVAKKDTEADLPCSTSDK